MEVLFENCPFCGSEAKLDNQLYIYEKLVAKHGQGCICVDCSNRDCGASMYVFGEEGEEYESVVEKAITKWNRRVAHV